MPLSLLLAAMPKSFVTSTSFVLDWKLALKVLYMPSMSSGSSTRKRKWRFLLIDAANAFNGVKRDLDALDNLAQVASQHMV